MKTLRLHPGKERSVLRRHPWIFASAIARGGADLGETVRVEAHDGRFLAWAAYSPASQIRARIWSWDAEQRIDATFFIAHCARAVCVRSRLDIASDACRLIHGESDGLPGVVVDRYGDTLVAQFLSAGAERWKAVLADALLQATGLQRIYERSDTSSRVREGLPEVRGWLRGDGPEQLVLQEHGWQLALNIAQGHKTGYYLDQRDNRRRFAEWCRIRGVRSVLNGFCYSGGFTVAALAGGASDVLSVDSSALALEQAAGNVALNGFEASRSRWLDADMNATLRQCDADGRRFDAIVLDPPKFAPTVAHAERAARAYKDLNRLALRVLEPGGLLFTFSCSGGIGVELFHKIVASAAIDAGVEAYIVERLGGAPDHPMSTTFPEGEYLKGLALLRKEG